MLPKRSTNPSHGKLKRSQARAAKAFAGGNVSTMPPSPNLTYGKGIIATTPGGGFVTLYLDGAPNATLAERLSSCGTLSTNDNVECLIFGTRVIVLGTISG